MIPFVMLSLDCPRKLRFGMGAVCEFQDLTGIPLMQLDEEMGVEMALKATWVMLRQEIPDLSWEDACRLIDNYAPDMPTVLEKTAEAVRIAFRRSKKKVITDKIKDLWSSLTSRTSLS
jgi:hypothetical protein